MKTSSLLNALLCTALLALSTAAGMAQSAPAKKQVPSQSNSSDRKSGQVNSADFKTAQAANDKSLGSAHATESLNASPMGKNELQQIAKNHDGAKNGAQSNPMYKDTGMAGTNPLNESKDKAAVNPAPKPHEETVEYKDPEDMTTRYRPGNNKTSKIDGGSGGAASAKAAVAPAKPHSSSH